jgi:hypothetical protein
MVDELASFTRERGRGKLAVFVNTPVRLFMLERIGYRAAGCTDNEAGHVTLVRPSYN